MPSPCLLIGAQRCHEPRVEAAVRVGKDREIGDDFTRIKLLDGERRQRRWSLGNHLPKIQLYYRFADADGSRCAITTHYVYSDIRLVIFNLCISLCQNKNSAFHD